MTLFETLVAHALTGAASRRDWDPAVAARYAVQAADAAFDAIVERNRRRLAAVARPRADMDKEQR